MIKASKIVIKETLYVCIVTLALSFVMQLAFFFSGKWDYTCITGNILGGGAMVLNFFLMGLGVEKAVGKDEKEAKNVLKLSHTLRTVLMFVLLVIGVALPYFSTLATIIPIIFPRIAVFLRPLWDKISNEKGVSKQDETK